MTSQDVLGLKVVVIAGGWSDEREISLDSGRACQKALTEAGFKGVDLLDVASGDFVSQLTSGGYDVAFVAMHGHYGEDGCIQGLLEILHMPYTFSGVLGSAVSTEKEVAKTLYREAGIPTPRGTDVAPGTELKAEDVDRIVDELGLPLFVKPAANGSSFGVTRVTSASQLADAVRLATQGGDRALIEECVTGTEITVPVIGNDEPKALPIVEIVTGAEFYDLKVKYEPSSMHHVIPARLEAGVYAHAQELAVRAHRALHLLGASRSDFIVREDGTPVILDGFRSSLRDRVPRALQEVRGVRARSPR